ncbi:hypothetical protein SDRG_06066 [Saprolegnia diclina VS20]|uniref:Uncharacterized protein n=1 Tax=Saprolegnia diclina (strain VS20) TaxID=1156394 RepID=T0QPF5_SAPDV|nr:hypothetical protein SDRG_06066 [Saprolegnia diclina VS20]EQC36626.1 hypothetical protein SDRG_06066 [Saprolegnia diclina VS20]|eukprot:XP_008610047.1 hypothetical protein SDRG_06066 [Saprolegnia diclina VS20]
MSAKHEALHAAIWGGAATNGPAPLSIGRQYVVVALRFILLVASAAYESAWTTDAAKATGIALALYLLAFLLFARRQLPLYIRLVFFLTLLSAFADVGRPLVQLRGREPMDWPQATLFAATLSVACASVGINIHILYQVVQQSFTNKQRRKLAKKQS